MQSSAPREFGWFTGWLEDSDRIVIVQDGEAVSARQLRNLALRGAGQFDAFAGHRIALHASRADVTFAALAAAQAVQAELLLVRELYPSGHTFWVDNEISAVFDERLEGRPVPGGRANYRSPAVLLTTSGTTGQPKVALHSLEKLVGRVRAGSADARWLLTYHPGSFAGLQVLLTAVAGRGVLLAYAGLSAAQTVKRALDSGATHLSGTPTFWRALLLARGAGTPPPDFRQITLGGEAVDQSTLDALQAAFPAARIIHIYASTEAGALFAVKDGRAGFPAAWLTAGVEGCRLRIRDGMLEVQSPRG
jgi:acyl-CoA synthetase (AMP-forming)/AMP-acid ligase II